MTLLETVIVGVVATMASDIWQQIQRPVTGIAPANWPVTGRWVLGFREGRIFDPGVGARAPLPGEAMVGWTFHYAIGIIYAAMYLGFLHFVMRTEPTLLNGLIFGLLTLAAPFLFMKPALGAGLFGLKAPNPAKGMFLSVSAHSVFGIGLYWGELLYRTIAG
ncbi:DUF2938 family protein [Agrobacterium sp. S2]|nr:DUF2938 family protein [Agrobacterium sp. S2]